MDTRQFLLDLALAAGSFVSVEGAENVPAEGVGTRTDEAPLKTGWPARVVSIGFNPGLFLVENDIKTGAEPPAVGGMGKRWCEP